MEKIEPIVYEHFPPTAKDPDFIRLFKSLLFSKEFHDQNVNNNRLYNKIFEMIRDNYKTIIKFD